MSSLQNFIEVTPLWKIQSSIIFSACGYIILEPEQYKRRTGPRKPDRHLSLLPSLSLTVQPSTWHPLLSISVLVAVTRKVCIQLSGAVVISRYSVLTLRLFLLNFCPSFFSAVKQTCLPSYFSEYIKLSYSYRTLYFWAINYTYSNNFQPAISVTNTE